MPMKRCLNGHFYDDIKYKECPYCRPDARNMGNIPNIQAAPMNETRREKAKDFSVGVGGEPLRRQVLTPGDKSNMAVNGETVAINNKEFGMVPKAPEEKQAVRQNPMVQPLIQPKNFAEQFKPQAVKVENKAEIKMEEQAKVVEMIPEKKIPLGEKTVFISKSFGDIDPIVGWLVCIDGPDKGCSYSLVSGRNYIGRGENMGVCLKNDKSVSRENQAIVSYDVKKNHFRVIPGEGRGLVYLNDEELCEYKQLKRKDVIEIGQTKLIFIPFCDEEFHW